MSNAAAAAAAKIVLKEARSLLARPMRTDEWRLLGEIQLVKEVSPGRWLVRVPSENPLRLEHVPTGMLLVGAFREMETDFASVPKSVQKIAKDSKVLHLNPRDYELAVFSHDQDYAAGWCWAVWNGCAVKVTLTKGQADAKMYVMLECCGATYADGLAYHGGVALFGGKAWKRCRREKSSWPEMFGDGGDADEKGV